MPTLKEMALQEFLDWELAQEEKHEWVEGRVLAFAGGTARHSMMALELASLILPHVRPCKTLGSDAMLLMERSARYADIIVTCDERDAAQSRTVRFPKLIVEVLSDSTAHVDRSEKLEEYTTLETLQEYVLIDSRKRWVQSIRRIDSAWNLLPPIRGGTLHLASIDLDIDLEKFFDSVEL